MKGISMKRHASPGRHTGVRITGTGVSLLALSVAATMVHIGPAQAIEPEPTPVISAATAVPITVDPLSDVDTEAIAMAADSFESGSVAAAAELAEAAASQDAVPIARTLYGMVAETDAGTVTVDRAGEATMSVDGMPEIGIAVAGVPDPTRATGLSDRLAL
jgi:hypothetical protein